jgi:hypothetical protein
MWSWLLILGTLIGYWVVLSCMVYVAKKAETCGSRGDTVGIEWLLKFDNTTNNN